MNLGFKAFTKAGESKFKQFQKDFFGALGDKEGGDEEKKAEGEEEEDPEIAEARREAEEKRRLKHEKMEEERETMRQQIRDKYGIKKKEVQKPEEDPGMDGRLGRKRKTPEEMAAEANAEEEDEFSKINIVVDSKDGSSRAKSSQGKTKSSASRSLCCCVK